MQLVFGIFIVKTVLHSIDFLPAFKAARHLVINRIGRLKPAFLISRRCSVLLLTLYNSVYPHRSEPTELSSAFNFYL